MKSYAREIKTLDDVKKVIDSPPVSWAEVVDCIEVCAKAIKNPNYKDHPKALDLRNKSTEIALELIPITRKVPNANKVKNVFISAIFGKAKNAEDIKLSIEEARDFLQQLNSKLRDRVSVDNSDEFIEEKINSVEILLRDIDQEASAVKLASHLRHEPFEHPYLSIDLCKRVIKDNPKNISAITCCASSSIDVGNYSGAEEYLDKVVDLEKRETPFTLIPRSRLHYYRGKNLDSNADFMKAMNFARMAANIRWREFNELPNAEKQSIDFIYALDHLEAMNNRIHTPEHEAIEQQIKRCHNEAIKNVPATSDNSYLLLTFISTKAKDGKPEEAESLISSFKEDNPEATEKHRSLIKRIENEIADNRKRQQQQFDLGDQPF